MNPIETSGTFSLEGLSAARKTGPEAAKLGQDQFLELMVAQLKNQDPLKPMQNGEFLGQIAQFGTVNGIKELQTSFSQLAGSLQSNQALMASSLVGRSVLIPAEQAVLSTGTAMSGSVELPAPVTNLALNVYDLSGQLVRRLELGSQAAGSTPFSWDGITDSGELATPGRYQLRAEAVYNGQSYAADTLVASRVDSVSLGGAQGLLLNVGGLGSVPFSDVKRIF